MSDSDPENKTTEPVIQTSPDAMAPGVKLNDRYVLEKELGRGGIGVVYLAHDLKLHDSPVVIKVLMTTLPRAQKDWFKEKFKGEIAALSRIDHPGVVRALDLGELHDGRSYLVMQYVVGVTLRSVINARGMELKRAASLIRQIGHALTAAHEEGVIHRDLKPENIMLHQRKEQEYAKLIDFGIASVKEPPGATTSTYSSSTAVAGTVPYMAPEQFRGRPTAASDIFAFGVITYEMLTGQLPFEPDSPYEMLKLQEAGVRLQPCALRRELPLAAQAAILKALSFEQQDRYRTASEFGEKLSLALSGDVAQEGSSFPVQPEGETIELVDTLATSRPAPSLRRLAAAGSVKWVVFAGLILAALIVSATLWRPHFGNTSDDKTRPTPIVASPERGLTYWLTARLNPKRSHPSLPFDLAGEEMVFSGGDLVRINLSSQQSGSLYAINEGPLQRNGAPQFNVLFPNMTTNNGSAEVAANQAIRIPLPSGAPEQDWFEFDPERGIEKIWLVWSQRSVPELEAVKGWANPTSRGEIGDANQIRAVAEYFSRQLPHGATVERDEALKRTTLKARGDVIIRVVKLEHR